MKTFKKIGLSCAVALLLPLSAQAASVSDFSGVEALDRDHHKMGWRARAFVPCFLADLGRHDVTQHDRHGLGMICNFGVAASGAFPIEPPPESEPGDGDHKDGYHVSTSPYSLVEITVEVPVADQLAALGHELPADVVAHAQKLADEQTLDSLGLLFFRCKLTSEHEHTAEEGRGRLENCGGLAINKSGWVVSVVDERIFHEQLLPLETRPKRVALYFKMHRHHDHGGPEASDNNGPAIPVAFAYVSMLNFFDVREHGICIPGRGHDSSANGSTHVVCEPEPHTHVTTSDHEWHAPVTRGIGFGFAEHRGPLFELMTALCLRDFDVCTLPFPVGKHWHRDHLEQALALIKQAPATQQTASQGPEEETDNFVLFSHDRDHHDGNADEHPHLRFVFAQVNEDLAVELYGLDRAAWWFINGAAYTGQASFHIPKLRVLASESFLIPRHHH